MATSICWLAVGNGPFNGRIRFDLVRAQPRVVVRCSQERLTAGVEVFLESLDQGFRRVKLRDDVRPTQFVSDVVIPDAFAIGRVEEWNTVAPKVERAVSKSLGIPFGLTKNALRPQRQFLGFNNANYRSIDTEGVVGRTICGLELLNSPNGHSGTFPKRKGQSANPLASALGRSGVCG